MTTDRDAGRATRNLTDVYQRFRHLIHEGAKFGIIGGIGVMIVLVGSDALHYDLGLGKFKSVTVATIVATVFTFLGNRYWSFRHRQGGGARSETLLFFVLNGIGLLIQYACIFLVTDAIGLSARIWYTAANLVGIGIGTLFRFWSYRKWIWISPEAALAKLRRGRHRKGRPPAAPTQLQQPIQPVPFVPSMPPLPPGQRVQLTKLPVRQPAQRPRS